MRAIVIGGGISGLACAYRLRQMAIPVRLLERTERAGGVIGSVEQDGFLFELGPQSFTSTELLSELMDSLGLGQELLRANPRAPRFVLAGGQLHRAPLSLQELLTTSLLGPATKWRLFTEAFRKSQPAEPDESLAHFVRRKFGAELLDHFVGPFVSGVYAGDPERLSLRSAFPAVYRWEKEHGSVLRGAMKSRPAKSKPRATLCSFRGGVATLVRALSEKLGDAVCYRASVASVSRRGANGKSPFELQMTTNGKAELVTASAVVVATDTASAARLLGNLSGPFRGDLDRIEYAPVAVVGAGYRREQVGHPADGFGFLVARKEGLRTLGCVWNSSLFPGRAPDGMVNFTSFAGGATDPELCQWSEGRIAETMAREVENVLRISGPPVTRIVRRYARALPQYNLGHGQTIAALREACARVPGLFLTGNYFDGPAIGACVEHAFGVAQSVSEYLASMDQVHGAQQVMGRSAPGSS